jgi:hypothetical protein
MVKQDFEQSNRKLGELSKSGIKEQPTENKIVISPSLADNYERAL